MNNNPQYWQARTPLRVQVLGLFFVLMVLALLGLLWFHWGQNIWLYSGIAGCVFTLAVFTLWQKTTLESTSRQMLCFDVTSGEFSLLNDASQLSPLHIVRIWQSVFAITLQVQLGPSNEIKQLTFWRGTLSVSCWRKLHIHLWRYQLQYQLADLKGAQ